MIDYAIKTNPKRFIDGNGRTVSLDFSVADVGSEDDLDPKFQSAFDVVHSGCALDRVADLQQAINHNCTIKRN